MELLKKFGWQPYFSKNIEACEEKDRIPARIIFEQKDIYRLAGPSGEQWGRLSGRLCYEVTERVELPAVGDWVMIEETGDQAVIHCVLPRKTTLVRKRVDSNRRSVNAAEDQILAANVDTAFILSPMDQDLNAGRIERYLTMAWSGSVRPVLLLTKSDLHPNPLEVVMEAEGLFPGLDVAAVSVHDDSETDRIRDHMIDAGSTAVLLGPSGAGKSSLTNRWLNQDVQAVNETRDGDGKGRHTTTSRQLFRLDNGGLIIDTPGLRAVGISEDADLSGVFEDIEELALNCRFRDCRHQDEPGCAILKAVIDGLLDPVRLERYQRLRKEAAADALRRNKSALKKEQKKFAKMVNEVKNMSKYKY